MLFSDLPCDIQEHIYRLAWCAKWRDSVLPEIRAVDYRRIGRNYSERLHQGRKTQHYYWFNHSEFNDLYRYDDPMHLSIHSAPYSSMCEIVGDIKWYI